MPLIAVYSAKGSPGATTVALALATVAPDEARAVVVECDPAGGDLMPRHRLAARPTLVDLAAAARSATDPDQVFAAAVQSLHIGDAVVSVVVAPAGGAQSRAALPELTGAGQGALTTPDRLVIADGGRLDAGSPSWPLVRLADVVLVLARGRVDALAQVREHLGGLLDMEPRRLVVLLAPGGVYAATEVTEVLSGFVAEELLRDADAITVIGPLPRDRYGAAVLGGELLAGRRWRRLPLLKATTRLLAYLIPQPAASVDGSTRESR